ncbi:LytTR family DNA-binding domain-containing protein [Arenibacter sp. GZD96]|uniref:LytR/AlgR family response regulator transcription factor n=1 Tax=Aurantibrevibacter litoralis TaxID=3106030 RepID=UPI002AFF1549|nr:LytTR family DNA-binding domain-containing protein [Arenibacter sp. GZD-96]MEA1785011.1 LytTR family DNA-binding domain-containing protein [Arenibacter sp. GZD-96]
MNVVIVEDEIAASDNLQYLLQQINPTIEIIAVLDSVRSAVDFFSKPNTAVLIFMDIHLADGISFEIFDQVKISIPVIFTTAYDKYALQAFKVNSIDYLLKPINEDELSEALAQFKNPTEPDPQLNDQMMGLLQFIKTQGKSFKTTYLVSHRDQLIPIKTNDIAYIFIDTGIIKAVTASQQTYVMDDKLEDIEKDLDPQAFYRVNRQCIINRTAIAHITTYFNGKLIVTVLPAAKERIIVSKAKAMDFKKWLNS